MCDRDDCDTPNATTPWCAACSCHITEISLPMHMGRNHPDPRIPGPVG